MTTLKGGEFLITETEAKNVFIPEEWNEEQKMIAQSCHDFLAQHVWPNLDRIDAQEEGLMPDLLNKAGELGLLGISVPEEYGGFGIVSQFSFRLTLSHPLPSCPNWKASGWMTSARISRDSTRRGPGRLKY